jgi:hypothetical protein
LKLKQLAARNMTSKKVTLGMPKSLGVSEEIQNFPKYNSASADGSSRYY